MVKEKISCWQGSKILYNLCMGKVVVVRRDGDPTTDRLSAEGYRPLVASGLKALSGEADVTSAIRRYIPAGVIGMKINGLTSKLNSTPVALTEVLSSVLEQAGTEDNDIVIWERTNRELVEAGFTLNASSFGRRCLGTDTDGVGYGRRFYSSGEVSSLLSRVLTDVVDYNMNLPVLKDHSIAGLSAGLKNMFGAINNPNKYHDNNCDPYCGEVNNLGPIRSRNRLTIIDATRVQYQGGPGYMAGYMARYGGLVISDDPVAADRVGLEVLERLRLENGLPTLEDAGRPAKYLRSAEALGLGTADFSRISLTVLFVNAEGGIREGELFG
ncbi:MAG: DUF362 domain-containing protein [Candidatus Zixiibacteriota bacterium]|nr:MAG: DUF362 domain-containing protein [candidate division Zixibacteria bacterium]